MKLISQYSIRTMNQECRNWSSWSGFGQTTISQGVKQYSILHKTSDIIKVLGFDFLTCDIDNSKHS